MGVYEEKEKIVRVTLADGKNEERSSPSCLAEQAAAQLSAYFLGKRKTFDLPLSFEKETPFRQSVYTQLLKIPYGKTATYRELAAMIGKGERNAAVCDSIIKNKAVYLCAIGGAGALAAKSIKQCDVIAYDDLGCESVKKLLFCDFPLTVAVDCSGGNIFAR